MWHINLIKIQSLFKELSCMLFGLDVRKDHTDHDKDLLYVEHYIIELSTLRNLFIPYQAAELPDLSRFLIELRLQNDHDDAEGEGQAPEIREDEGVRRVVQVVKQSSVPLPKP